MLSPLFVINVMIQLIVVCDQFLWLEWYYTYFLIKMNFWITFRLLELRVGNFDLEVESFPFIVKRPPILFVLLCCVQFLLCSCHSKRLFKLIRVGLSQYRLNLYHTLLHRPISRYKGFQILLIPGTVSYFSDSGDQNGIDLLFKGGNNIDEVLIFEEANCAVTNLGVLAAKRFNESLNKFLQVRLQFVHFCNLNDF